MGGMNLPLVFACLQFLNLPRKFFIPHDRSLCGFSVLSTLRLDVVFYHDMSCKFACLAMVFSR